MIILLKNKTEYKLFLYFHGYEQITDPANVSPILNFQDAK